MKKLLLPCFFFITAMTGGARYVFLKALRK